MKIFMGFGTTVTCRGIQEYSNHSNVFLVNSTIMIMIVYSNNNIREIKDPRNLSAIRYTIPMPLQETKGCFKPVSVISVA